MTDFLLLAFIFLVAGVAAVPVASRLGLGSVLGYLIAGIAISPVLALLHVDVLSIQHFAEFGVVMMLFLIGLELEPRRLWEMRARLFGLGGGQIAGTTVLVAAAAMVLGQPWTIALTVGLVLALSSTAIVLQTLGEKGLMKSDGGEGSFAVLLTQDIAVIPMLALIPLLALPELAVHGGHVAEDGHGGALSLVDGLAGWQLALINVGAIAFVILVGSVLTRPLFRFIAAAQLRELFTATALMMVIGIALLMSLVGLSPALGTFLAGVVLANSEYRHELESDIDPFKGLLLGLFFMTVGAAIDFGLLFGAFGTIVGLTLGLMLIKGVVLYALGVIFHLKGADRWLFALGLAQAGEFGFVLLGFTVSNAVLPAALADVLLLVVALSMLLTPALFILYDRVIAPRFATAEARGPDEMPSDGQILIAGAGRVGGLINRILLSAGYRTTMIDYSSRQIDALRTFGIRLFFGDATRPDLLQAAGIAEARVLIVALDDAEQITALVKYVRHAYPNVHVMARAINRHHVYELWAAGCRDIVRETYDSSLRMGRSTLEALGLDRATAQEMVDAFDEVDRAAMIEVAPVYRPGVPVLENPEYVEKIREIIGPRQEALKTRMIAIRSAAERKTGS